VTASIARSGAQPGQKAKAAQLAALRSMTEAQWMAKVRQIAKLYGWTSYHTRNSIGSDHGWPDLVLANASQRRTVFAELKRETGKPTDAQIQWLAHLESCGFEVAVWRPRDEAEVIAVLGPRKLRAAWGEGGAQ
jgi:hypothetical protein